MNEKKAFALTDHQPRQFRIDLQSGLLHPAEFCNSPNQDDRPVGDSIELLIIHGISLPPGEFGGPYIQQFFQNCLDCDAHPWFDEIRGVEVSTHLLIARDGSVLQFVPFHKRAWHAGDSKFRGRRRCNDFSVGIEMEGTDDLAYTDAQYATLVSATAALIHAYPGLSARTIAGHSDIAPGRKTDPGPAFDWFRLYDGLLNVQTVAL